MSASSSTTRAGLLASVLTSLLAAALLSAAAPAQQGPRLHAAIAASEHRGAVPAIAWLCEDYLPTLAAWPDGLDPRGPLALTLSAEGLDIRPTEVRVPDGAVAFGAATFAGAGGGPALLWRCAHDGSEQWTVQPGFELPRRWHALLQAIEADVLDVPRSLAMPVLAGHLSSGVAEGDPRAGLLRIAPSLCGDVTWLAWRERDVVRVKGRSEGGLTLPLALLVLAVAEGDAEPTALQLRAFAARDADRGEAARQLGRADRALDTETLRALLLADDAVRLTAIDALVRRRAWQELPQIVAAAAPDLPWASLAARDAVFELWRDASPEVRQATRQALQRSESLRLRAIDVDAIETQQQGTPVDDAPHDDPRGRILLVLLSTAFGLLGLWRRERARGDLQTV
ncbi:MAG: hypothetical protein KAI24_02275 [Planctomycetes bacterium]|nr:hypothetical protein [Planctomycetota bacterium]